MARDPRQGSAGSTSGRERAQVEAPRQRTFGDSGGDEGWTLIGPAEEAEAPPAESRAASVAELPAVLPAGLSPEIAAEPRPAAPNANREQAPVEGPRAPSSSVAPAPAQRSVLPTAVAAVALIALAALAWRHARVARALEAQRARVESPRDDAGELARLRDEAERLERERALAEFRAGEAAVALEAAAAREGAERQRAEAAADERDGLRGELAAARSELDEARERAQVARTRADALESELDGVRRRPSAPAIGPDELRAEVCDRWLARLEAGEGAAARAVLETGIAAGLFTRGARDGTEFLEALASAAQGLERARIESATSTAPATAVSLAALEHLGRARALFSDFGREAADWLTRDSRGGPAALPDARAERVEGALRNLEAAGARLGADVAALHAADWDWIATRGPLQDPGLAREHARAFGCEHLDELARDAAARLRTECFADGTALPKRLLAAECLPAWTAILAAQATRGADALELLWLDAARRWYAASEPADAFAWHGLEAPRAAQRTRDWRAELWLRVQLAAPDSAWPPRPGEVSLYCLSGPSRARWRSDRRVDEGGAGGWTWLRTHFDGSGAVLGEPALVAVERDGERARLAQADLVLLDLRATQPGCEVAPAPVAPLAAPPAALGFAAREVLGRAAEASRSLCLVVRQGDTARWFSPRLGLVLEERELDSGTARVELALREEAP